MGSSLGKKRKPLVIVLLITQMRVEGGDYLKIVYKIMIELLFTQMPKPVFDGLETIVATMNNILTHLFYVFNVLCITKDPFCLWM